MTTGSYATGRWFEAASRAVLEDMATLHVHVYELQFLHELCIYSPQIFVDMMYSVLPFEEEDCSSHQDFILDV